MQKDVYSVVKKEDKKGGHFKASNSLADVLLTFKIKTRHAKNLI